MKLGFPLSGIGGLIAAETFGPWGFAALLVCVMAWLAHSYIQTRARTYEKEIDAFPEVMERRLRDRYRKRRRRR